MKRKTIMAFIAVGNLAIVTSDGEGLVTAFSPYTDLWSLRLTDLRQLKVLISLAMIEKDSRKMVSKNMFLS